MRSTAVVVAAATISKAVASVQVLGPATNLAIANAVIAPDGYSRNTVLAGGTFPGPLISAQPNSQFTITVQDQLQNTSMDTATSIHWHGMFLKNATWADGSSFVSQCPITAGHSFTYQFSANGQVGTFWYHSHYNAQYCDGLRGPLVIYDPNDPYASMYNVDTPDTVITLADWYHSTSRNHRPLDYPDSTLINGFGRAWPTNTTAVRNTTLSVVSAAQGLSYRLRIVSISCQPAFTFSIDGHTLTIIEADGTLHQPYTVDSMTIYAGQRYSAILTANQAINNYWIRALPVIDGLVFPDPFVSGINSAILRYNGAPLIDPTTTSTAGSNPMVESRLVPRTSAAAPGTPRLSAPDVYALNLDFTLDIAAFQYALNGVETKLPSVPVLLQILSGSQSVQNMIPSRNIIPLPANRVIQLSFPGGAPAPDTHHPIHLHGHAFSVIRAAGQSTYNFANPPRRDVVSMGGENDNVTIRFTTNNSGPWFLYDHIAWHQDAGFSAIFVEDTPADIAASIDPPSAVNSLCSAWSASPTPTPPPGCTITASSQVFPTNCMDPGCVWAGPPGSDSPDYCAFPRPSTVTQPATCTITASSQVTPTNCLQPGCVWAGPAGQNAPNRCDGAQPSTSPPPTSTTATPTATCTITASSQVFPTNCMQPGCVWAGPSGSDSPNTC